MYKLKMGDIVFTFSTELDALKALCLLLFMINDKFDKAEVLQARVILDDLEDILNSRVVRNSRLHLPGSENYE